jgi:hypothetical protein
MRGVPAASTLGGGPAIRFSFDFEGTLSVPMTSEMVAAFPGEELLLIRCDYERDDPYGTSAECQHLLDTFELTSSL